MRSPILLATLFTVACATSNPAPQTAPDRILVVGSDGNAVHQTATDETSHADLKAPIAQVWPAIALAYTELGIAPSVSDRATWSYGNAGFVAPKRMQNRPLVDFFNCGSGMTGPLVNSGRVFATVITTLTANATGGTSAATHVTATVRSNDGTSTSAVTCASTGAIEEYIRLATEKRLAGG
jgi:hypothetical protein